MVVTSAHSADREPLDRLIVITSIGDRERSKATLGLSLVSRGLDQECRRLPTDEEAASAAAPAGSFTPQVSLERPVGETWLLHIAKEPTEERHFVRGERTVSRRPHRRKTDLVQESYERTGGFAVFHHQETATRQTNPVGLF
jgi:hypothetical protein